MRSTGVTLDWSGGFGYAMFSMKETISEKLKISILLHLQNTTWLCFLFPKVDFICIEKCVCEVTTQFMIILNIEMIGLL